MRILKDIFDLFYPNLCLNCDNSLIKGEIVLCSICKHDLPIIQIHDYCKNEVKTVFYGKVPIHKAASFLYFRKEGICKELIHHLKYKNKPEIGTFIGDWFGFLLQKSGEFKDVDYIIPVPLHAKKIKKRGYNQVTDLGLSLSDAIKTTYKPGVLTRISANETQTHKKRFDRFSNTTTKFYLTDVTVFENKHVLLIDDVITTGATLEACCNELLKTKNITISILTIAFTQKN